MQRYLLLGSIVLGCMLPLAADSTAVAQMASGGFSAAPYQSGGYQTLSSKTERALGFYGVSAQSMATLRQVPRRPISPPARPRLPKDKPFGTDQLQPTVSPFMNLFRIEDLESAPNYYAFVRPQLQQQQFVQEQRLDNQRLRRQLQRTSASVGVSAGGNAGFPSTGHGTRFMDIGGYYGSPQD